MGVWGAERGGVRSKRQDEVSVGLLCVIRGAGTCLWYVGPIDAFLASFLLFDSITTYSPPLSLCHRSLAPSRAATLTHAS